MVDIPRDRLTPTHGPQYPFANELKGYVQGTTDSGQTWAISREITSNISEKSHDEIVVDLEVVERKIFPDKIEEDVIGEAAFPFEDFSASEKLSYEENVVVEWSDVELYQHNAQPAKYSQSNDRWAFAGEAIIPNIKDWHDKNELRIDTSDID